MKFYYIQDTRSYIGNCMVFWGPNQSGYVTDIRKAGLYSEKAAREICQNRKTDVAYPEDYIKQKLQITCDMQYVDFSKAKWKNVKKNGRW